jgi:hypothetical protein
VVLRKQVGGEGGGTPDPRYGAHPHRAAGAAARDGAVRLDHPGSGEHRAVAGVEGRIVLEHCDRRDGRGDAITGIQSGETCHGRGLQRAEGLRRRLHVHAAVRDDERPRVARVEPLEPDRRTGMRAGHEGSLQ